MKHSVPKKIILIGASTGGPGEIQKIISSLPILMNTTVIVAQHMVDGFMDSFANNLQTISSNKISIANNGEVCKSSHIYICDGETKVDANNLTFSKKPTPQNAYNPNINILFNSFVPYCKDVKILGLILTGIGDDGVDASVALSKNGAKVITQTQESAIVDGMPSRARATIQNIEIYDTKGIIKTINEFCNV